HLDKPESERPPYYPPICMPTDGGGGNFCAPGCVTHQDCPSRWTCEPVGTTQCNPDGAVGMMNCTSDLDCPSNSKCVNPMVNGKRFTSEALQKEIKICTCDPSIANHCGAGFVCNAGIGTKTVDGPILEHYCTQENSLCGENGS